MLVFSKARLVFLSVPKTGSTAYEHALAPLASIVINAPPELKHAPIFRYNRFIRPMLDKFVDTEMDILAVVREPIDWLGSWYRYRQRAELSGKPTSTEGLSFDDFVMAYVARNTPAFAKIGSQARFLAPARNGISATHLFRYEDQDGLMNFLQTRLKAAVVTERINVSPGTPPLLSAAVEAKLRQTAQEDFRLWDSIPPGGAIIPAPLSSTDAELSLSTR